MDFRKLIAYDQWANAKVFEAFRRLEKAEQRERAKRLFSHILAAQSVWLNRIEDKPEMPEVWPDLSISEMEKMMKANKKRLSNLKGQKVKEVSYQNSKGDRFENTVDEILLHLTIHGQHHRAQIATLLRKGGIKPPPTDFIYFLRKDN